MRRWRQTRRLASARALLAASLLVALGALLLPGSAAAKEARLLKAPIGSFAEPRGLAVDQGSHDIYVIDGRNEQQQIIVSATAGSFKVRFGGVGGEERELPFDAGPEQVRDALREIVCEVGDPCLIVDGGPGNAAGSKPYVVGFGGRRLTTTDVEQLECGDGATPLSGGSGCTVTTTRAGVNGQINRYHADGTPADFSALGSNAIDGRGPESDQTPQIGLRFLAASLQQVAVDESGGASDGDIYVTQFLDQVVDVFAPSGEYLGQLSELGSACGVAADAGGDLYVGDLSGAVHKYDPAANPVVNGDQIAGLPFSEACALAAGAGPTAGFLFAGQLFGGLFKLDASSGEKKYEISKENTTITVDPVSGHLFTAKGNSVNEYDASGASSAGPPRTIAAGSEGSGLGTQVSGVGVDGTTGTAGTVYVARTGVSHLDVYGPFVKLPDVATGQPSEVKATTATLNGTIGADQGPAASCEFQYLPEASYLTSLAQAKAEGKNPIEIAEAAFAGAAGAPCEPGGPFTGNAVNAVSAAATGLIVAGRYEYRIVGENLNGASVGDPESLETAGPPQLKGGAVAAITTTSATISGEVNPATLSTSFAVEYVSETQFKESGYANATVTPAPAQNIGSAGGFIAVSQPLSGLLPDTAYHFRLLAENEAGTVRGEDHRFVTFAPSAGLLDGRAYEQVSPATKLGEVIPPEPGFRTGLGGTCKACTPGWDKQIAPMQASPDGSAFAYEGGPFSGGLAAGANEYVAKRGSGGWQTSALSMPQLRDVEYQGFKAFSSDLSRAVLYQISPSLTPEAPTDFANLYLEQVGEEGLATLITVEPPSRSPGEEGVNSFRVTYAGANAGTDTAAPLSHVIFQANDALSEEVAGIAPAAPPVGAEETDLYEWSGGQLHLVNVLPGNEEAAADAVIGSGLLMARGGENLAVDHAISDDGSRIFWSDKPSGQVYVREDGTRTIEIQDPGKFLTATPDGSKVLLSDGCLYDLEAEGCEDLTVDQGHLHQGGFEGMAGASEDLSRVYFVATQALTPPGEVNANPAGPEHAEDGEFNLYLREEGAVADEGTTSFIGILEEDDNINEGIGVWRAAAGSRLAQASPDGRYLAFESRARLTGYDNTVRVGKGCLEGGHKDPPPCFEVFRYDAQQHSLTCPSCNPSGERPLGQSNLSLISGNNGAFPQLDNLPPDGEGRLFFESQDTLTTADLNGHIQDVYEWEPGGVGNCERPDGCLALISSGHGPKDSHFVNASANGDDVFFTTRDALVPQDIDGDFLDLYDARVGGGIATIEHPPCLGEACRGPGSLAPGGPTAGSAGFIGPPNPRTKPCRKGFVKKHGRCVRKPRHHRQKKHKRSAKHKTGGSK